MTGRGGERQRMASEKSVAEIAGFLADSYESEGRHAMRIVIVET